MNTFSFCLLHLVVEEIISSHYDQYFLLNSAISFILCSLECIPCVSLWGGKYLKGRDKWELFKPLKCAVGEIVYTSSKLYLCLFLILGDELSDFCSATCFYHDILPPHPKLLESVGKGLEHLRFWAKINLSSLSSLIAQADLWRNKLYSRGDNSPPCHVSDFRRKLQFFPI